jgi:hypothetical protein
MKKGIKSRKKQAHNFEFHGAKKSEFPNNFFFPLPG